YACFSEDFSADPGNRTFIHKFTEEAKQFFRDRDPEAQSVPVTAKVVLKARNEIRPLNTLAQGGPQGSAKKGGRGRDKI
ncbi:MAG: hypothetical protein VX005_04955, partial [Pseudomonadota bacterium]|nr:hypothetical protein [Pseudomonadota bacterium]